MSKFSKYIGSQFGNPHGFVGKICCLIMNIINKKMYKNIAKTIELDEINEMLDIGYGNGHLFKMLFKKKKIDLYGIDISSDMMKACIKKNKKAYKLNKLHLKVGDCQNLEYDDSSFSCVTSINTIYFWSDAIKGLEEIKRVLKDGKSFYNVVYTKEWLDKLSYTKYGFNKYTEEELKNIGIKAGYSKIEIKTIVKNKSFMVIYTK